MSYTVFKNVIELVSKWQPVEQVALHKLFTKFLGTPIVKRGNLIVGLKYSIASLII